MTNEELIAKFIALEQEMRALAREVRTGFGTTTPVEDFMEEWADRLNQIIKSNSEVKNERQSA